MKNSLLKNMNKAIFPVIIGSSLCLTSFIVYDNYNMLVPENAFSTPKNVEKQLKSNAVFSVSTVVTAAQAFKATLSSTQITTLQKTYTTALGKKWSNLPCGSGCRNGIQLSTLSTSQLAAAKAVMQAALGTTSGAGYDLMNQILLADDYLNANGGGSGYSSGIYFISFLNEPSTTGAWMLQFGGHHMAYTISFNNGQVVGTTPQMLGVEPTSFTLNGTTYTPLAARKTALQTMLASFTTAQLTTAKLSSTFSDCVMSPGESSGGTGTMPTTKVGIQASALTSAQQALVLAAIQHWTSDLDSYTQTALNTLYSNGMSGTYIGWTGSGTSGSASSFLNASTNYVRIDGPRVWIEFVCQNGVIFSSQIHYHSVWRDHQSDYGNDLANTTLGTVELVGNAVKMVSIYPNPASEQLNIKVENALQRGKISIYDASGKLIISKKNISGKEANLAVGQLETGNYMVVISDANQTFSAKFIKK